MMIGRWISNQVGNGDRKKVGAEPGQIASPGRFVGVGADDITVELGAAVVNDIEHFFPRGSGHIFPSGK